MKSFDTEKSDMIKRKKKKEINMILKQIEDAEWGLRKNLFGHKIKCLHLLPNIKNF